MADGRGEHIAVVGGGTCGGFVAGREKMAAETTAAVADGAPSWEERYAALEAKYKEQGERFLVMAKEKSDLEAMHTEKLPTTGKETNTFSVADVIDAKKEVIRMQQRNHDLLGKLNAFELDHGHTKDELADAKLTVDDLKAQLRTKHDELDENRTSLATAKQMAAKYEALAEDAEGRLSQATQELSDMGGELKRMTEMYTAVEKEAKLIKEHKAKLREKDRAINKLERQLHLVLDTSSRKLNLTQNSLHSNQQIMSELRAEYEEFYALTEQEFQAERSERKAEYDRLEKQHTRLLSIQFEEKQHMLREHQAIVEALQTQFQEYRRTAEALFKAEAQKLEGKLHIQMEEYEEELRYVIRMKDKAFDDMIACKDAKILTLIEGTDFQQLLIRHELEKEQLKRTQAEEMTAARREWQVQQAKIDHAINQRQLKADAEMQTLKARLAEAEETFQSRVRDEQERSRRQEETARDDRLAMERLQKQLDASMQARETLEQEKLNLRHRLVFQKHRYGGHADESVSSLATRMKKEFAELSKKFDTLTADYNALLDRRAAEQKSQALLHAKVGKLEAQLAKKSARAAQVETTFEGYLSLRQGMSPAAARGTLEATVARSPRSLLPTKGSRKRGDGDPSDAGAGGGIAAASQPHSHDGAANSPYIRREKARQERAKKQRGLSINAFSRTEVQQGGTGSKPERTASIKHRREE